MGAAWHSMVGQAIPRDGHAVTYQDGFVEPDTGNGTYKVHERSIPSSDRATAIRGIW